MKLFSRKKTIILRSEQQKEEFIEKLENAHAKYELKPDRDSVYNNHPSYIVSISASELAKVG